MVTTTFTSVKIADYMMGRIQETFLMKKEEDLLTDLISGILEKDSNQHKGLSG